MEVEINETLRVDFVFTPFLFSSISVCAGITFGRPCGFPHSFKEVDLGWLREMEWEWMGGTGWKRILVQKGRFR